MNAATPAYVVEAMRLGSVFFTPTYVTSLLSECTGAILADTTRRLNYSDHLIRHNISMNGAGLGMSFSFAVISDGSGVSCGRATKEMCALDPETVRATRSYWTVLQHSKKNFTNIMHNLGQIFADSTF